MAAPSGPQESAIRSADRTLQILDAIGAHPDGLTAIQLSERLGLSTATTYRLLSTLTARAYLVRAHGARYVLGRAVDDLSRAMRAQLVVTTEVRAVMREIHAAARAPIYLTVFRGDEIAVAAVADSPRLPRMAQLEIGFAAGAQATAFGKVMLAARDDDAVAAYLEQHHAERTGPRALSDDQLRAQLDEVRALQIAVEVEEFRPGIGCVAAPVRSATGQVFAALSLSTEVDDLAARRHDLETIIRRGAWHVSRRMQN